MGCPTTLLNPPPLKWPFTVKCVFFPFLHKKGAFINLKQFDAVRKISQPATSPVTDQKGLKGKFFEDEWVGVGVRAALRITLNHSSHFNKRAELSEKYLRCSQEPKQTQKWWRTCFESFFAPVGRLVLLLPQQVKHQHQTKLLLHATSF